MEITKPNVCVYYHAEILQSGGEQGVTAICLRYALMEDWAPSVRIKLYGEHLRFESKHLEADDGEILCKVLRCVRHAAILGGSNGLCRTPE